MPSSFFNKNGHTVDHVHSGRVNAENEITNVTDDTLTFKSGNRERCTHIICCFGYDFYCPFLPAEFQQGRLEDLYQFVFPVNDPSIAFLGFARPIIGSIPLVTEMQCLWAFRVLSGKVQLGSEEHLAEKQQRHNEKWERRLPGRGNLRTLVLPSTYVAMMLKEAYPGRSPGEHFWQKPMRALKFMSWIPSGSIRFAVDPNIDDEKFNSLWSKRSHGLFLAYVLPFIILVSRLLQIERVVDWFVERKEAKRMKTKAGQADSQNSPSIEAHMPKKPRQSRIKKAA